MRVCYAQVIRVPSDFLAREGLKLTPEYTVGKEIGGGVQGRVLALNTADGDKTDKLLKVQTCSLSLLSLLSQGMQFTLAIQHMKHLAGVQALMCSVDSWCMCAGDEVQAGNCCDWFGCGIEARMAHRTAA